MLHLDAIVVGNLGGSSFTAIHLTSFPNFHAVVNIMKGSYNIVDHIIQGRVSLTCYHKVGIFFLSWVRVSNFSSEPQVSGLPMPRLLDLRRSSNLDIHILFL